MIQALAPVRAMTLWCSAKMVNSIDVGDRVAHARRQPAAPGARSRQPYTTANESSDNRNRSAPLQRKSFVTDGYYRNGNRS